MQQSWNNPSPAQSNVSTVAVISESPLLDPFTKELTNALQHFEPSLRLTSESVLSDLGPNAFDKSTDFRLSAYLAQQEDKHGIVLYECDPSMSPWTKLCLRHADLILVLTEPKEANKTASKLETSVQNYAPRTSKQMIFLHKEDVKYPLNIAEWLRNRGWITTHYHVKCPRRMYPSFKRRQQYRSTTTYNVHGDFSRIARYLTGNSVALVLGGGGARGCSHVGMIKAILEAGIPIDHVAGVSIGSLIGGLYCQERDITELTVKARGFCQKINQYWRQAFDLTWPLTSYFTGKEFNARIRDCFTDERDICDLWLPYFTITTDITTSAMRVHDYGSLWRYVRASMSLAGYLPPLCDPHDGHLLLDGGYTNNLPADLMRARTGARHTLAIDVGAQDNVDFTNYGDTLSGFGVLMSKFWGKTVNVPNAADIQSRLAYVSCQRQLESVKGADYCDYIRPPIDKYKTLAFGLFDEIRDVG